MSTHHDSYRAQTPKQGLAPRLAKELDEIKKEDWLNPIAMSILKQAVAKKAKTVFLNNATFQIEYDHWFYDNECIMLKRIDNKAFVPFGYIRLRRIQDFAFGEDT